MLDELKKGRPNTDGADQGFLTSYFDDLLEAPLFRPPSDGVKLTGNYRLPMGYQMDASYFCKSLALASISCVSCVANMLAHVLHLSYLNV